MARAISSAVDPKTLSRLLEAILRLIGRLAIVAGLAVAAIAAHLARGGFSAADGVLAIVLLGPSVVLLVFAAGLRETLRLPGRVRELPGQGAEIGRIAGDARTFGLRRAPSLLWRLRVPVGSARDLLGITAPLHVFTPYFLGLTLLAAALSVALVVGGAVALVLLALG